MSTGSFWAQIQEAIDHFPVGFGYKPALMSLVFLLCAIIFSKHSGQMDPRRDRPSHRDARAHLKEQITRIWCFKFGASIEMQVCICKILLNKAGMLPTLRP